VEEANHDRFMRMLSRKWRTPASNVTDGKPYRIDPAGGVTLAKADKMTVMAKQSKTRKSSPRPDTSQDASNFPRTPDTLTAPELNLSNHFLIAMPMMHDPIFGGAVVYVCEHNANGALGVIINKPTDMTMELLFERIDLKLEINPGRAPLAASAVMFGGPVQVERGFVLHVPPGEFSSMMKVSDDISLTTSKDVLEAVASGQGPQRLLVSLGCAGWSAGQLEEEIVKNGWLTVQADPAIIFDLPIEERFNAAIKLLGIDPMMLTGEAGHA
jgi:putative transcriptional regulator